MRRTRYLSVLHCNSQTASWAFDCSGSRFALTGFSQAKPCLRSCAATIQLGAFSSAASTGLGVGNVQSKVVDVVAVATAPNTHSVFPEKPIITTSFSSASVNQFLGLYDNALVSPGVLPVQLLKAAEKLASVEKPSEKPSSFTLTLPSSR